MASDPTPAARPPHPEPAPAAPPSHPGPTPAAPPSHPGPTQAARSPHPGPARLDAIDRSLIELLRRDGRASVRDLAARLHISRANAYARLDRLKREGVITGFTVTVNPERYGYGLSAWVAVKLRQQSWRAFRDRLHEVPSVELATLVTGDFDILLLVRAADSRELRDMVLERLQSMPEVVNTQTTVIFDEVAPLRRP